MELDLLKELGFETASNELEKKLELKRKMMIAYEHYRFVEPGVIEAFNEDLKKRTLKRTGKKNINLYENYDKLVLKDIKGFKEIPPKSVLESMKKAKDLGCFDEFVIAKIEATVEYKDPILFGKIHGCDDLFAVDQWDSDVKISDLLKEMEG